MKRSGAPACDLAPLCITNRSGMTMPSLLERHPQNAVLASIIASAVAIIIGIGSAFYSFHVSLSVQDRQARLEQVAKFDQSTQQLYDAAQSFIEAINNNNKGLDPARAKLRTILASEINSTGNISQFFSKNAKAHAEKYEDALQEFNDVSQKTSGVADMRPWAESFGRVLDQKSTLNYEFHTELGT